MNEPQVWTLIGVFAAVSVGLITVITQMFTRTMSAGFSELKAEIGALDTKVEVKLDAMGERIDGLKTEMMLRFEQVDRRFEQVDQRFEQVDRRFERLEKQVDGLDGDVQAIAKKAFPD